MTSTPSVTDHALESLSRHGLLLKQDKVVPNVVSLVTGEPVSGSWWAHPDAHQVLGVLRQLARHPDVLVVTELEGRPTEPGRSLPSPYLQVVTPGYFEAMTIPLLKGRLPMTSDDPPHVGRGPG